MHPFGKKNYHYIKIHGQLNLKKWGTDVYRRTSSYFLFRMLSSHGFVNYHDFSVHYIFEDFHEFRHWLWFSVMNYNHVRYILEAEKQTNVTHAKRFDETFSISMSPISHDLIYSCSTAFKYHLLSFFFTYVRNFVLQTVKWKPLFLRSVTFVFFICVISS